MQILCERATKLRLKHNELARKYVIEGLAASQERETVCDALTELNSSIFILRENLAQSVGAILVATGNIERDQIKIWMKEHLK